MTRRVYNIIFVGLSGFPYGMASVQRLKLLSEGLLKADCNVLVVNRLSVHDKSKHPDLKSEGVFNSINYIYTSGSPFRSTSFLKRNIQKFNGFLNEIRLIYRLKKEKKQDVLILYSQHFFDVLYYRLLAKISGTKILYMYVEFRSKITTRKLRNKFNDFLIDNYSFSFTDGIIPISDFLVKHVRNKYPEKPVLKIPIVVDISRYNNLAGTNNENQGRYFLFCGSTEYHEVIRFIIESYKLFGRYDIALILVLNGPAAQMKIIHKFINESAISGIKIFSGITDLELNNLYANASGLLIPMRPSIQDIARFPHKIGEYLLSSVPVITTNYGEISSYLKNMETAFIAEQYDVNEFSKMMRVVIENPELSKIVGGKGKILAQREFNHIVNGKKIRDFIDELFKN